MSMSARQPLCPAGVLRLISGASAWRLLLLAIMRRSSGRKPLDDVRDPTEDSATVSGSCRESAMSLQEAAHLYIAADASMRHHLVRRPEANVSSGPQRCQAALHCRLRAAAGRPRHGGDCRADAECWQTGVAGRAGKLVGQLQTAQHIRAAVRRSEFPEANCRTIGMRMSLAYIRQV